MAKKSNIKKINRKDEKKIKAIFALEGDWLCYDDGHGAIKFRIVPVSEVAKVYNDNKSFTLSYHTEGRKYVMFVHSNLCYELHNQNEVMVKGA